MSPSAITADLFQFVTPAGAAGYVQVQATTTLGTSWLTTQTGYIYTGLEDYVSLTPFRILDTRSTSCIQCSGGALGMYLMINVPITVYTYNPTSHQSVPADASAAVIYVTRGEWDGVFTPRGVSQRDGTADGLKSQLHRRNGRAQPRDGHARSER